MPGAEVFRATNLYEKTTKRNCRRKAEQRFLARPLMHDASKSSRCRVTNDAVPRLTKRRRGVITASALRVSVVTRVAAHRDLASPFLDFDDSATFLDGSVRVSLSRAS